MTQRNETWSGDLSRPEPPGAFPVPNVPGHGVYTYPNAYAPSQQFQVQVNHSRHGPPPPLPPRTISVQPTFPSDYANVSHIPYQQGTGYGNNQVNNYSRPPFPHAHAGAADSGQMLPYRHDGFTTLGHPGNSEPPPYSPPASQSTPRGLLYGRPPPGGRPPPPQIPTPHAGASFPSARPNQPSDVGRYQASQFHASASQPSPPRVGQKKALLVGIDYSKNRDRRLKLKWGVYDAKEMSRFLQQHLDFHPNDIQVLTDDQRNNLPTAANIVAGMRWLVAGAQPSDCLFFYFSGHATQIEDKDWDEPDGFDECLCAVDYDGRKNPPAGLIVDDDIHDIMVKPLPRGCRLTAVFDCCNSGTLLDLPYIYDSQGVLKPNRLDIVQRKRSEAVVISLSACKDGGRAYEVRGGGALREAFITYMMRRGNQGTYLEVIQSLRVHMVQNSLVQRPQLSSSHWIDTDQRFIITG